MDSEERLKPDDPDAFEDAEEFDDTEELEDARQPQVIQDPRKARVPQDMASATPERSEDAEDGSAPEEAAMSIKLEAFEGPLDLLLHLIKKEEVDIWNIPIARITEQYLEYLDMMKVLNINVAGEWVMMAATLIYIKSRMLVPQEKKAEDAQGDAEDPRNELVYQLLEHQKFKNAAEMLYTREEVENSVWNKLPSEVLEDGDEVIAVTLFDLLSAFREVVKRFENQRVYELVQEEVTIEQKIDEIRKRFLIHDKLQFSSFFDAARSKRHLIVTFLALLELVRMREVWLFQKNTFGEIQITKMKETA